LLAATASAQEVKYVEGKDGVTYQETRRVVRRPIWETRMESREQTVYKQNYRTDYVPTQRNYMVPITEYRWEPEWVGRWNPFATPYVTYRWKPVTRWEPRSDTVQVPVTRQEVVPEKVTTQVPVTTPRYAEDEYISRVAVSAKPQGSSGSSSDPFNRDSGVAGRDTVGGLQRLDDTSRDGDTWRPAQSLRR
jgi:hypothetical protein